MDGICLDVYTLFYADFFWGVVALDDDVAHSRPPCPSKTAKSPTKDAYSIGHTDWAYQTTQTNNALHPRFAPSSTVTIAWIFAHFRRIIYGISLI